MSIRGLRLQRCSVRWIVVVPRNQLKPWFRRATVDGASAWRSADRQRFVGHGIWHCTFNEICFPFNVSNMAFCMWGIPFGASLMKVVVIISPYSDFSDLFQYGEEIYYLKQSKMNSRSGVPGVSRNTRTGVFFLSCFFFVFENLW